MDMYAKPDLTKKVRYGRRQREVEMEERGEREERIVDIYVTADDLDPDPAQQDTVPRSKAEEQHGGSDESKENHSRAAAVCLGLLCLLLLAAIIALVIKYFELSKETDNLQQIKSSLDRLQTRFNNLTEQKGHLQTSFDQLLSRYNNLTEERDGIKRRICESIPGFTFDGGLCYHISTDFRDWEQSRRYCTDKQSDLIVINSKEKQEVVGKAVAHLNLYLWLGLTYKKEEEIWKWVDGTPLTAPTYWSPGEPNNLEENCVEFTERGWNDMSCATPIRCICERVI